MGKIRSLCLASVIGWVVLLFATPIYPDISEINIYQNVLFLSTSSLFVIKILKAVVFMSAVIIFYKWAKKIFNKQLALFATFIFITLPWNLYLFSFHPISSVILLFSLIILHMKLSKPKILIIFFTLAMLSFGQIKTAVLDSNAFVNEIRPEKITSEIGIETKTQFLSMNRTFLINKYPRKIMFNYPTIVLLKLFDKTVSYFDFEQWASPLDSYAIILRSKLLPKGNFPLIYHWQIPVLFAGVFFFSL